MTLEEALEEHAIPRRILVECDECDESLYDTDEGEPTMWRPSYLSTLIKTIARKHGSEKSHYGINVAIDSEPNPVREIEATITVNG